MLILPGNTGISEKSKMILYKDTVNPILLLHPF